VMSTAHHPKSGRAISRSRPDEADIAPLLGLEDGASLYQAPPRHFGLFVLGRATALHQGKDTREWRRADPDACGHVADLLDAEGFISATLPLRKGRVLIIVTGARLKRTDASFLKHIVQQAFPVIETIDLLDRLASEAAFRERQTIARDLHDSTIQPYIGLRHAVAAGIEQFGWYEVSGGEGYCPETERKLVALSHLTASLMQMHALAQRSTHAYAQMEAQLAHQSQILDQIHESVLTMDQMGYITSWNRGAEQLFGYTALEAIGRNILFLYADEDDGGDGNDMQPDLFAEQGGRMMEVRRRKKSGEVFWASLSLSPLRDLADRPTGLIAYLTDITERKLAEERIFHMAHHDELTGLPNRNLMHDRIDQAIRNAARAGTGVALAFVDLDGFKLVNDGLGHKAGDELLKVVSRRMGACLRRNDTLARFGGDEFVILLPDQTHDPLALSPLLEKIRVAVTEPVQVAGQAVQVSCSMGVVMYPRDGADASALLMNADAAMYRAKDLGSNNFQFYAREMNASVEEKLMLLDGLRHAVQETVEGHGDSGNRFHLLYQPKVDLKTGRIFGVEALIRWHHPEHGVVSPQRFIGLAEESGLIVQIGEWVVRTACQQAKTWLACGLPPITVSVNVSARQFEESRLVERVAAALQDSGLPAELLELEVTESLIMRDLQKAVDKMRELKAMGVSLSVDDFGTGYSSLSALKSFPISRLKIDKSFVSELADNPDDQAIAMAVISLGHKLNLKVIAEGVETEQQCAFLRANECDEMQGYLFSKPVTAGEIEDMVEQYVAKPGSCAKLRLVEPQPQANAPLALAG